VFTSDIDIYAVSESGFLEEEVAIFEASPTTIDLAELAWANTLESRREWVDRQRAMGRSEDEVRALILDYYASVDKASPWDFLREAYSLPDLASPLQTDPERYGEALRRMREKDAVEARGRTTEFRWRGA